MGKNVFSPKGVPETSMHLGPLNSVQGAVKKETQIQPYTRAYQKENNIRD
jgi:hypothetical protein